MHREFDFDELIAFREVPELLPSRRLGRPLCLSTVRIWATRGLRGVRLKSVRIGGIRYTSEAWLRDFIRATGGADSE